MRLDCLLKNACKYADTEECNPNCIIHKEFYYLLESSNVPKNYWENKLLYPSEQDLAAFETLKEIKEDIDEFVKSGRFLYIYGNSGNGKTSQAIKILKSFLAQRCVGNRFSDLALFYYFPNLVIQSKKFENKEEVNAIMEAVTTRELLVLDDIATTTKVSEYDMFVLNTIINSRYSNKLSTILTSNVEPDKLNRFYDGRIIDRILSDIVIHISGGSRRGYVNEYKRRG
nr:MAG TPA: replicative helicase [Caudoviricetes sp.]